MHRPFIIYTRVKKINVTALTIRKTEGVDLGVGFREIIIEIVGIDNDIKQACNIRIEIKVDL